MSSMTDFNDLHQSAGPNAVKACIDSAIQSTPHFDGNVKASDINRTWNAPTPLPNALPPVAAFDAELLPVALRAWVMDIANAMQCPPDFPAIGAIAALSSLIGARAVIQPKVRVEWRVVPNLWALIIGRPGVMKSPALGEVLRPLTSLQADERKAWRAAYDSWKLDCKVAALQDEANEKKARGYAAKGDIATARQLLESGDCYVPT